MAGEGNRDELELWTKTELLRARFEVSVAVHHTVLLVVVFYVAVVGASIWWGFFELVEHGMSRSWWEWTISAIGLAALWFSVFALIFGWTQHLVIYLMHRRSRGRVG